MDGCAYAGKPDLLETYGGMRDEEKQFIIDLIKNGEAKITEDLRLNYPASVGDTVYVYCQKRWDAAITLQTHWRKCRYDPRYEMCHKIQLRGSDDILNESQDNRFKSIIWRFLHIFSVNKMIMTIYLYLFIFIYIYLYLFIFIYIYLYLFIINYLIILIHFYLMIYIKIRYKTNKNKLFYLYNNV